MKKRNQSIAYKIIVPLFLELLVVAATLCIAPSKLVRKEWLKNNLDVVACDVDIVTNEINQELRRVSESGKAISDMFGRMYNFGGTSLTNFMCSVATTDLGAETIAFYNADKQLISSREYDKNSIYNEDIGLALKGTSVSKLRLYQNNLYAVSVEPVKVGNEIVGAIETKVDLSKPEFLNRFPDTVGCEFTIVNGNVRAHTTIKGQENTLISDTVYESLKKGEQWSGEVIVNGETYVAYYWPVEGVKGLSLFVGEYAEAMNEATGLISRFILICEIVGNLFVLSLIIGLIITMVIKPVKATQKAIDGLSTGDADLTYRLPVKGNDEVAQLSNGVNKFIELLQNMMKSIMDKSEQVNEVINNLGSTAQETASATTQIMANIDSVKNQATTQTVAVSNTTDILGESNSHMQKLNENVKTQADDISQSSGAIEQMIGNINSVSASANKMTTSFADLTNVITEGSSNVKACSEVIKQIEEKSKVLAEANNTIKLISSQTNLLAMNAMIESAHAGDAGKGFAVVAEEIRKLAENSSDQAGSIDQNIKEITSLILEGGHLSDLSQKSFNAIDNQVTVVDPLVRQISEAMEEQSAGSTQILESLTSMKDASNVVDNSCNVVTEKLNNVRSEMESVAMVSNVILGSMDEMAAGSQEISKATQNVSDLALNSKEAMDGINELIGKFKV